MISTSNLTCRETWEVNEKYSKYLITDFQLMIILTSSYLLCCKLLEGIFFSYSSLNLWQPALCQPHSNRECNKGGLVSNIIKPIKRETNFDINLFCKKFINKGSGHVIQMLARNSELWELCAILWGFLLLFFQFYFSVTRAYINSTLIFVLLYALNFSSIFSP